MRRYWIVLLLTVVGVAAGSAYALWGPLHYTARAVFHANPPVLTHGEPVDWQATAGRALATLTQRSSLTNLITQYSLYPRERARLPMEDVVVEMRRAIHLQQLADRTILISYSYPDRRLAWQVAQNLTSSFIDECMRLRSLKVTSTRALIESSLLSAPLPDSTPDSLSKAVALRFRDYAADTLARLHLSEQMERLKLGESLALLDPPVLPANPDENRTLIVSLSGLAGLLVGLALHFVRHRLAAKTP